MVLPTEYKHGAFFKSLENTIQLLEVRNNTDPIFIQQVTELKQNISLLDHLYTDYNKATDQLRALIIQYNSIQKKARVQLRAIQIKFSKKTDNSSNSTNQFYEQF